MAVGITAHLLNAAHRRVSNRPAKASYSVQGIDVKSLFFAILTAKIGRSSGR